MADKPVHTWSRGSQSYTVSLHGKVTPEHAPVSVVAQELARMAVENGTLREALAATRLESPNVELHAALEGVRPIAENASGLTTDEEAAIQRAARAIDRHKPRPIPEPVPPIEPEPEPPEEDLTPPSFVEGSPV